MHVFQPLPHEVIEINPFQIIGEEGGIVTTKLDDKVNIMSITWGSLGVLWGRNVATIYVRNDRLTKEILDETDYFSVSFFGGTQKSAMKYVGKVSGREEDKVKTVGFHINESQGVAFIDESKFTIICKKMCEMPMDSEFLADQEILNEYYQGKAGYTMYVGEIVELLGR